MWPLPLGHQSTIGVRLVRAADAVAVYEAAPADPTEPLFEQPMPLAGRVVGVAAGVVIAAVALAAHLPVIAGLGAVVLLGALTARGSRTHVEHGALVQRFEPAPLRPGAARVIPAERIRGVEVLHEHDTEAAPGRADEYWAALRLTDRRRPMSLGRRHYDRASAEADASRLRAALGLR